VSAVNEARGPVWLFALLATFVVAAGGCAKAGAPVLLVEVTSMSALADVESLHVSVREDSDGGAAKHDELVYKTPDGGVTISDRAWTLGVRVPNDAGDLTITVEAFDGGGHTLAQGSLQVKRQPGTSSTVKVRLGSGLSGDDGGIPNADARDVGEVPDAAGVAGTTGAAGSDGATGGASGRIGTGGASGGATGTAGHGGAGGGAGTAGTGMAGTLGTAGAGGTAGTTGTAGTAGTTGGTGGAAGGDTPPARALNVTAPAAVYIHGKAGVDTNAKSLGKLVVDLGVSSGGYTPWLGKRGFHVFGASFTTTCTVTMGRDAVGVCRADQFSMIRDQVTAGLVTLAATYPQEDWGYFLKDNVPRWSDVIFTGFSSGGTTAAFIGHTQVRAWRVVSRSAPRDNTCGVVGAAPPYNPANPPWRTNCPTAEIAGWLDAPSMTPLDRFYGLVGGVDSEYGDIMFTMDRAMYPGLPVQWDVAGATLTGTNRFYSPSSGHSDFLVTAQSKTAPLNTDTVLEIAFGVPLDHRSPTF
jgi:hypothetical protein